MLADEKRDELKVAMHMSKRERTRRFKILDLVLEIIVDSFRSGVEGD
jgi:hypothetical protein